ncbi:MAG: TerB family tellurite resistance protein [Prevotellaceae bacterium]|jgi:DnaJ like chaperone protein|nr:TerB family tellurite resistance protein [Prevotellaceae bacterium]
MAKYAKWIGGGLGFVLGGGPVGALIGFVLGSILDSSEPINTKKIGGKRTNTDEGDFKMSLLVLIACVMKADGNPKKAELAIVKQFLVRNFGEQGALEALSILKEILKQEINETAVAQQIGRFMNYSSKLELMHLLFQIAYADGYMAAAEQRVLQRIAAQFNLSQADFNSLRAPYTKTQDVNWAYKTLEIEPNAKDEEIKKAYRRMAMKYHPDKLNSLGEDVRKTATEKFRSIKDAYESLKKQRGFS